MTPGDDEGGEAGNAEDVAGASSAQQAESSAAAVKFPFFYVDKRGKTTIHTLECLVVSASALFVSMQACNSIV